MKKFLAAAVFSCFSLSLFANSFSEEMLNIYAKLSVRFVLMSTLKDELSESVNICIGSKAEDERAATTLIDLMHEHYPAGIGEYKIYVIKSDYSNINFCKEASLFFVLSIEDIDLPKVITFAQENKILTMSYDQVLVEDGIDISLFIGREIRPYISLANIFAKDIYLDNVLLRVSKIYKKQEE
ncbi:MAG: hypothetical protein JXQ67_05040 [Campylobacterales bacterium]|nr:hypothetical protein [Campylobacterales bacterium]